MEILAHRAVSLNQSSQYLDFLVSNQISIFLVWSQILDPNAAKLLNRRSMRVKR